MLMSSPSNIIHMQAAQGDSAQEGGKTIVRPPEQTTAASVWMQHRLQFRISFCTSLARFL
jgi:hypothetical protein